MFSNSKWIWAENNTIANDWVRFECKFQADSKGTYYLDIGAETKYYLYINGKLVVFDGGLFRESTPGNGYYDSIDISSHIKEGVNEMVIDAWFYGNGGRNNSRLDSAGIIFECKELGITSGSHVLCGRLNAFYQTDNRNPSYLYGGYNIGYNSALEGCIFLNSFEYASYGESPFNLLEKRPIPLFVFSENKICEYEKEGNFYCVSLPYAMHFSPYMEVEANGGEIIDIISDRYMVKGGPGDDLNIYAGHRYEYICRQGQQSYSAYNWIFGEKVIFTIPQGVKVLALGYRESGYNCKINVPKTGDRFLDRLLNKCTRTLYVCMRENFMDCPDRERGQWIGDVSVQAPQVFYCLDDNAVLLLKKAVKDFFRLKKGSVLMGNVPGDNFTELPPQSLNAISEFGMVAEYYYNTGDKELLGISYQPIIDYLKLWYIEEDGFISKREGNWYWFDHGYNIDGKVLENCLYYSALKFALYVAGELGFDRDNEFLTFRINSIKNNFHKFWNGSYYTSSDFADDRANAMAVIAGLAESQHHINIRRILLSVFNSTPYMEYYVLEALCKMGYKEDAIKRLKCRYSYLAENNNSTLWEDFYLLGTKNHAWTGGPLTIIMKYFFNKD